LGIVEQIASYAVPKRWRAEVAVFQKGSPTFSMAGSRWFPCRRALDAGGFMLAKLLKLCTLSAFGSQNPALALAILLALMAGHGPAVAQNVTEFPLPTANSGPFDITTGPDGALWFTEGGANNIGRMTTAGAVTEFPIPTFGGARGITMGPDGALWFVERGGNTQIGRITTAGVFTEFPIPSGMSSVYMSITTGPDGALWFTEDQANWIGRITTAGVVTEFPIPTARSRSRH
jgi:streptogramin lyase